LLVRWHRLERPHRHADKRQQLATDDDEGDKSIAAILRCATQHTS
jgi:hypothetical protein